MEQSKRYVRLGLFVMISLTILVAVLFLLGGRKLFQPTFTFETYFNESVAGLELGAPVRFRGVPLGQVSEILTSGADYERDVSMDRGKAYIVVRATINLSAKEVEQVKRDAPLMAKRGLRAQTQLAGITGQQYLALDFLDPAKFPPLEFPWTPKFFYLPSAPSLTGQIVDNAQAFLANLNEADVKTLGRNLNALIVDLDKKLNDLPVEKLVKNANATIEHIDGILATGRIERTLLKLDSVSGRLDTLLATPGLNQTLDNLGGITTRLRKLSDSGDIDRMVMRIDDTVERLDALLGDNQYDARVIVQDLRVAADNLRTVSETVKQYPAGALVGGPPEKVRLPGNSR